MACPTEAWQGIGRAIRWCSSVAWRDRPQRTESDGGVRIGMLEGSDGSWGCAPDPELHGGNGTC